LPPSRVGRTRADREPLPPDHRRGSYCPDQSRIKSNNKPATARPQLTTSTNLAYNSSTSDIAATPGGRRSSHSSGTRRPAATRSRTARRSVSGGPVTPRRKIRPGLKCGRPRGARRGIVNGLREDHAPFLPNGRSMNVRCGAREGRGRRRPPPRSPARWPEPSALKKNRFFCGPSTAAGLRSLQGLIQSLVRNRYRFGTFRFRLSPVAERSLDRGRLLPSVESRDSRPRRVGRGTGVRE
jgi:hypothetical protein